MPRQDTLGLYGKGICKTASGHLRYHSPAALRGRYVHRVVVDRLIDETPYSIRLLLPWPFEIHHMDYNKEHNCPHNLLLLEETFHSMLTADRRRDDGGRFGRKFVPHWTQPEWAKEKSLNFDFGEEEIPF